MICKHFIPFCKLSFHFIDSFLFCAEAFYFLFYFSLVWYSHTCLFLLLFLLVSNPNRSLPTLVSRKLLTMFSSRSLLEVWVWRLGLWGCPQAAWEIFRWGFPSISWVGFLQESRMQSEEPRSLLPSDILTCLLPNLLPTSRCHGALAYCLLGCAKPGGTIRNICNDLATVTWATLLIWGFPSPFLTRLKHQLLTVLVSLTFTVRMGTLTKVKLLRCVHCSVIWEPERPGRREGRLPTKAEGCGRCCDRPSFPGTVGDASGKTVHSGRLGLAWWCGFQCGPGCFVSFFTPVFKPPGSVSYSNPFYQTPCILK